MTTGGNLIEQAQSVKIAAEAHGSSGTSYAMYAANSGSANPSATRNIIRDVADSVVVTASGSSAAGTSQVAAMMAANGENIIENVGKGVTVEASGGYSTSSAMHAASNGSNIIRGVGAGDDGRAVTVKATGGASATAMAGYSGKNVIGGENEADKISGNVLIRGESVLTGTVSDQSARGMYAYGGENIVRNIAGSVEVQAEMSSNKGTTSAYGMFSQSAQNLIQDVTGNVTVSARGASVNYGMFATGWRTTDPDQLGHNTIRDVEGTVRVTAEGGKEAIGMYAAKWGSGSSYPYGGTNTIENAGRVEINATTTDSAGSAYAMRAQDGGHNIIDNRMVVGEGPVGIIITAAGAARSYALYASGAGSSNEIHGSETSGNRVELHGDVYAAGGGKNILITGAGDDYIEIDGKVTGNFQLNAGDGHDTLELRAASWADFSARYQTWLQANFNDMSIENLQWILGDSSGAVPGWLIDMVNSYNTLHPDAPLDVDYAALGIEPPVGESLHAGSTEVHTDADFANAASYSSGHTSDAPSADGAPRHDPDAGNANDANADNQSGSNQERESTLADILQTDDSGHAVNNHVDHHGDATHDAIFGNGDDHVRVHGDISGTSHDTLEFALGGGHNALIVDGDARHAAITGGDDGNDISVHGALDGHITLGDGADHADLGAMHGGTVDLGAGDDTLTLHGFTGGLLDGGEGDDTLLLTLDGLGGNDALGSSGAFSGLFEEGAVKGFENLILDMSGGNDDTLDLGALLNNLKDLGHGEDFTVRITGDANDRVDTSALTNAGWTCHDNGDGTSHWTSADEATLTFVIQNGL